MYDYDRTGSLFALLMILLLPLISAAGCSPAVIEPTMAVPQTVPATAVPPASPPAASTADLAEADAPTQSLQSEPSPPTPTAESALEAFFFRNTADCGLLLPLVTTYEGSLTDQVSPNSADLQSVLEAAPEEAHAAIERVIEAPQTVALAAYRVGEEENGVFLNAGVPMPLASVVKLIHLVAYAESAAAGELDPTQTVTVADLERFYLPTLDLRSHQQALEFLEEEGRLFGSPPALLLDEVVTMMIEFSANSATDYLHTELGQERVEQTAVNLGLDLHTAPCPFLGQFLAMANHTRPKLQVLELTERYLADPQLYGAEVSQLTAAFSEDDAFREEAIAWRRETRRPELSTQRLFSETFNARGTAESYAALMARLAQNGLSSAESSFTVRRHLEWPMRFEANQERFSNLGYKGGSLPGILTTAYYAYPIGETTPVVVALFYHDLPQNTYRSWLRSQAHDELARWLLYDPQAIPSIRELLDSAAASPDA